MKMAEEWEGSNGVATQNGKEEPRKKLKGGSLVHYARKGIDDGATLLGDRWLCRKRMAMIVAPSGQGKSTMSIQAAIEWSCGKKSFGIETPFLNGLRVLLIQAEDDDGDVTEMSAVIDHLDLTEAQKTIVGRNTHCEPVYGLVGQDFEDALRFCCKEFHPDLVIINPLTSYIADDGRDAKLVADFLHRLGRVIEEFNCGALIFHHTPKTTGQNNQEWSTFDWQYAGAGSALLTNWMRAVIAISPSKVVPGLFKFIAGKRGKRTGWIDSERYFQHSTIPGVLRWEDAKGPSVDRAEKQNGLDTEKALSFVPLCNTIGKKEYNALLRNNGFTIEGAKNVTSLLQNSGDIHEWFLDRPKGQPGGKLQCWGRAPQPQPRESTVTVGFAPSGEVTHVTVISDPSQCMGG